MICTPTSFKRWTRSALAEIERELSFMASFVRPNVVGIHFSQTELVLVNQMSHHGE
jgi:hypothetical protein